MEGNINKTKVIEVISYRINEFISTYETKRDAMSKYNARLFIASAMLILEDLQIEEEELLIDNKEIFNELKKF